MKKYITQDEEYEHVPLDDHEHYYYCTDIEIASTLLAKNFKLISVDKIGPMKATFIFERRTGIQDIIDGFWNNQIEVHPLEFANARKNLKSRIYGMSGLKNY